MRIEYLREMTALAMRSREEEMKSRRPQFTRERLHMSLGRRLLRMCRSSSEGRSQRVARCCCLDAKVVCLMWSFF